MHELVILGAILVFFGLPLTAFVIAARGLATMGSLRRWLGRTSFPAARA